MKHDIRVDLKKLHPWLQYLIKKGLKKLKKQGIYIIITEGFRTVAHQNKLYNQGRKTPGIIVTWAKGTDYASQHQWGIAFDIAIIDDLNTKKKEDVYDLKTIKKVARAFKKLSLSWGGDWISPVDTPHIYIGKWGSTTAKLKRKFGTPDKFKKYWKRKVKGKTRLYKAKDMNKKKVKCWIPKGKSVEVLYYSKLGYAKVKYGNKYGYVFRSRLKKL